MINTFNWFLVNRQSIIDTVLEVESILVNKKLSTLYIYQIIKTQLKNNYPILVRKKILKNHKFCIGGYYLINQDKLGKKSILLEFFLPNQSTIEISTLFFNNIAILIADTILHEVIHMRQYRSAHYKLEDNPTLFSKIELQAYAFNIGCELLDNVGRKNIIKIIEKNQLSKFSQTWNMYLELCKYNYTHVILKKLKRYVEYNISLAETGFPFKSGKWLK